MNHQIYEEQDLPIEDFAQIGLAEMGRLNLDDDDIAALLSGRRTDMLRFENLYSDKIHIPALDAKLSLRPNPDGELELMLHPIYKEAQNSKWVTEKEAEKLEKGEAINIEKTILDDDGELKEVLIEFDRDTNEFIVTDSEKVLAPDKVNNETLTPEQKERYRKGKEVELSDGTKFQYAPAEPKGMRSNRLALIASIIIDGGVSYVLYKGLHALFGQKQQETGKSKGYLEALQQMQQEEQKKGSGMEFQKKAEYSRGYSRSGMSR
jgi:hypothetical protein